MITDTVFKSDIAKEWSTILALKGWGPVRTLATGGGAVAVNFTPPEEFYNLLLVLAYCTLDNVLGELIRQGTVVCLKKQCFQLGDKMESAKSVIPWLDYNLINTGRTARNDLAHKSKIASKKDCLKYVEAVGQQLKAWNIIS